MISKFESVQKKCLKWILIEEELSYYSHVTYLRKYQQANILPVSYKFLLNDLVLFYKVDYKHIPLCSMYAKLSNIFQGNKSVEIV